MVSRHTPETSLTCTRAIPTGELSGILVIPHGKFWCPGCQSVNVFLKVCKGKRRSEETQVTDGPTARASDQDTRAAECGSDEDVTRPSPAGELFGIQEDDGIKGRKVEGGIGVTNATARRSFSLPTDRLPSGRRGTCTHFTLIAPKHAPISKE